MGIIKGDEGIELADSEVETDGVDTDNTSDDEDECDTGK